nr:tripartite motif-containing protein 59-like [Nerophis lumbriciformis]
MDSLEEDLTCSVCYSLYSDPRVLPCSHTFCRSCLDSLLHASHNYSIWRPLHQPLKCPNCRSVVELPQAGVDMLPTNVSLRAIVEKYQKNSKPKAPECPEHPGQPLNMYCVQDRKVICGLCLTVGQHQGHTIDDLQATFAREKQTLSLLLEQLSAGRWAQVCELGEQLEKEKARCESAVKQDRQEVAEFFHTLEMALIKKRQAYMEVLDKALAEVSLSYNPLIHRVKELQEEQVDLISFAESVGEEESPLAFLEKVHAFRQRVYDYKVASLPRALNLSVTPRAADYLRRNWNTVTLGSLDEAPVPNLCTRCGGATSKANGGPARYCNWLGPQMILPVLTLLLVVVSLCWLGVPQVSQGPRELFTPVGEQVEWAYAVTKMLIQRCIVYILSMLEMFLQQLTDFFTNLASPLDFSLLFTS